MRRGRSWVGEPVILLLRPFVSLASRDFSRDAGRDDLIAEKKTLLHGRVDAAMKGKREQELAGSGRLPHHQQTRGMAAPTLDAFDTPSSSSHDRK